MNKKEIEQNKNYERKILKSAGFQDSEFEVNECYLNKNDFIHYVKIKKIEKKANNILLMVHGYMGSNIGFFKLYQKLQNDFHIISIDLPGQGLSSSIDETPNSAKDWIDYFVINIKQFVDKLELKQFSICAHSMGAFIMTHFIDRYPEMISEVYLMSPGGVNFENPEFEKTKEKFLKGANCIKKAIVRSVVKSIFREKKAPLNLWYFTLFRNRIVKNIYGGRRMCLNQEEKDLFIPLYQSIYNSKPSSD